MSDDEVFWQVGLTGRKDATPFQEGEGLDALVKALRNLIAYEAEHTPDGYIPSGNIGIYWHHLPIVAPADTTPERGETE